MTVEDVRKEVDNIRAMSGDYEIAHAAEDALHRAVLEHIADGCEDAQLLAHEALKTEEIDFARWCA